MQNTSEHISIPNHEVFFYQDASFWVGVSFILALAIIMKPVLSVLNSIMNKQIQKIKDTISESKQLEIDAKNLCKNYQQKLDNLQEETKSILNDSNKRIDLLKKATLKKMDLNLQNKEEMAERSLNIMKSKTLSEINSIITKNVLEKVKESLIKDLTTKKQDDLIDKSIKNISKIKL